MTVIGITGSLASGKSEAARFFQNRGAAVFDADRSARKVIEKGKPVYRALLKIFGKSFLKKNGQIDRKKLALHAFGHPGDLKKLNTLIHPAVIFDCIRIIHEAASQKRQVVLDVPLLFESHMQGLADVTIVIASTRKKMLERARVRGIPKPLAQKILLAQWPLGKKKRLADFVIENNGSLKDLARKLGEVMKQINGGKTKDGH